MTMGFKHQVVMCEQPQEIIQITLNHLDALLKIVDNTESQQYVQMAMDGICEVHSSF